MTPPLMHLVHVNVAIARYPAGHPEMAGFADQLDTVNRLARDSPGFVWTADDGEAGDAVAVFGHPRVLANLSMWRSIEALQQFTYSGLHGGAVRQRRTWFEVPDGPSYALWWAPADHRPTWTEARDRLEHLARSGPSSYAFTFTKPFGPPEG